MFDRNTAKSLFLTALRRLPGDPYQMAKILRIQPIAANKSPSPAKSKESLQLDDADWSGVLNAWIDSNLAADAVRNAVFLKLVVVKLNRDWSSIIMCKILRAPCRISASQRVAQ